MKAGIKYKIEISKLSNCLCFFCKWLLLKTSYMYDITLRSVAASVDGVGIRARDLETDYTRCDWICEQAGKRCCQKHFCLEFHFISFDNSLSIFYYLFLYYPSLPCLVDCYNIHIHNLIGSEDFVCLSCHAHVLSFLPFFVPTITFHVIDIPFWYFLLISSSSLFPFVFIACGSQCSLSLSLSMCSACFFIPSSSTSKFIYSSRCPFRLRCAAPACSHSLSCLFVPISAF